MYVREPDSLRFLHPLTYNLIFPNLWAPVFEHQVKIIFSRIYERVVRPSLERVYEDKILQMQGYNDLQNIEPMKETDPERNDYE